MRKRTDNVVDSWLGDNSNKKGLEIYEQKFVSAEKKLQSMDIFAPQSNQVHLIYECRIVLVGFDSYDSTVGILLLGFYY
jgi:hypothetical protein